jgi:hypothetical protein
MRVRGDAGLLAGWMLRRFLNDQRGQTSSDYMGMLLVVAVIIGAVVVSGAGERIATHADALICRIAGGESCNKPEKAENPYRPTYPCVTAGATNKVTLSGSFNVRFVNVKLEGGVEYERVQRSDGTVAVTVRLSTSGGVGPALASRLKASLPTGLDVAIKGGQEGGITFVLPNNEAANTFADQLQETTAALAAGPIVSRIKGWDVHIDVPPVESVYYQTGPGASLSYGADAGGAYAEGKLDVQHALGARYNVKTNETTVYYKISGKAEGGGAFGRYLGLSGAADGQIAVTLDSHGRPKKLSVLVNGQGELVGGAGGKFRNLEQLTQAINASGVGADVTATDGTGKRFEAQVDLDLTDPAIRNSALAFLQGVNPVTGDPADANQAAEDLWNALRSNAQVSYRTYDTESSKRGGKIDVAGNGGGATYESTDRELTGAYYYDPTRGGFVPWEGCHPS